MKRKIYVAFFLPLLLWNSGCGSNKKEVRDINDASRDNMVGEMVLKSSAFQDGEVIPVRYTCSGEDISPPLEWSKPPEGTRGFALICEDPDAPSGTWIHWVAYRISSETLSLDEGVPPVEETSSGMRQGKNDFNKIGYGGPCPPPGKEHRYFFRIFALDEAADFPAGLTKGELLEKIEGHIIGSAQLMGKFSR